MTWNEVRKAVEESDSPEWKLLVKVLDGWIDYVRDGRDGERFIELDVMDDMAHDICVYRKSLADLVESSSLRSSGGGKF